MNINAMFAGMNSRNWYLHPVRKILSALNAKVRIQESSYLHSAPALHLPPLFRLLLLPEAVVGPAFHEAKNFFRSEEQ